MSETTPPNVGQALRELEAARDEAAVDALLGKTIFEVTPLVSAIHVQGRPELARPILLDALQKARDEGREQGKVELGEPRPLQLRGAVADLMVDELAKQYQKASVYGSLAQKWSMRARELGATDLFEADGRSNEASLAWARAVLEKRVEAATRRDEGRGVRRGGGGDGRAWVSRRSARSDGIVVRDLRRV